MPTIKHDHKCDKCGKPATKNLQQIYIVYKITNNGDFKEENSWSSGDNNFYCDKCYEREV